MTLAALLAEKGVRRALIVDDAYDPLPRAADLAEEGPQWTFFFDDLMEQDREILRAIEPNYDARGTEALTLDDGFVLELWQARDRLRPELVNPLFERYDRDMADDMRFLDALQRQLEVLGLECSTAGRGFEAAAADVDLIVIDLFLGSAQNGDAIEHSKTVLGRVIAARRATPPLVLLMSRSSRLMNKRDEFRDDAGLIESAFRTLAKADFLIEGKLDRKLEVLARHRNDSTKIAQFVDAWASGVSAALGRTVRLIRNLDLPDYAHIQQMLLAEEGEPTGSYMVDIFDRVLQHEVESEAAIIDTAIAMNDITTESYPPPNVAGSPDLQNLVYRSLFQHRRRMTLTASWSTVAFGDILRPTAVPAGQDASARLGLADVGHEQVLAVMTPSCDLQRNGARRLLLLVGRLRPLKPRDWTYGADPIRTAVADLNGERFWIQWDLKHIDTIGLDSLQTALAPGGGLELVARLRESHALEIQQRLLGFMGRVGLPAPMPATFPVQVQVCVVGPDRMPVPLDVPTLANDGVCMVGPEGQRLILTEEVCEDIIDALVTADVEIQERFRAATAYLVAHPEELFQALARGIEVSGPEKTAPKPIRSPSGALTAGGKLREIGLICRNLDMAKALTNNLSASGGVVLYVHDVAEDQAVDALIEQAIDAPAPAEVVAVAVDEPLGELPPTSEAVPDVGEEEVGVQGSLDGDAAPDPTPPAAPIAAPPAEN